MNQSEILAQFRKDAEKVLGTLPGARCAAAKIATADLTEDDVKDAVKLLTKSGWKFTDVIGDVPVVSRFTYSSSRMAKIPCFVREKASSIKNYIPSFLLVEKNLSRVRDGVRAALFQLVAVELLKYQPGLTIKDLLDPDTGLNICTAESGARSAACSWLPVPNLYIISPHIDPGFFQHVQKSMGKGMSL